MTVKQDVEFKVDNILYLGKSDAEFPFAKKTALIRQASKPFCTVQLDMQHKTQPDSAQALQLHEQSLTHLHSLSKTSDFNQPANATLQIKRRLLI
jgi:hypothetical protein